MHTNAKLFGAGFFDSFLQQKIKINKLKKRKKNHWFIVICYLN
jgi:hypothetical protein